MTGDPDLHVAGLIASRILDQLVVPAAHDDPGHVPARVHAALVDRLDPDYIWAIGHRAIAYREQQRYDEAVADLNRAIGLDSAQAWLYAERGDLAEHVAGDVWCLVRAA